MAAGQALNLLFLAVSCECRQQNVGPFLPEFRPLMQRNVCHCETRVPRQTPTGWLAFPPPVFYCRAIPSLESHEEHVHPPPQSSDTERVLRAAAKECLRRKKGPSSRRITFLLC